MDVPIFFIDRPLFDPGTATAAFGYRLGDLSFTEKLAFPPLSDPAAAQTPGFRKLLHLTAFVLGVSYFKLKAPFRLEAPDLPLSEAERAFVLDIYENGLGEFYARNDLKRFGRLTLTAPADDTVLPALALP